MTELVVLGSGCFAPEPGEKGSAVRNPAGYALRLGRETLLFDFGFGNLRQMFRARIDPSTVTHAFFSHRHPDHIGDLPALLFYFRSSRKPANPVLRLLGPRGFSGFFQRLTRAYYPWISPRGFKLEVQELEESQKISGNAWTVRCREVPHSTEALAFRFESKSASLCYTGDTGFDPGLAMFARETDLFVLECSLPDRQKNESHLRTSQAIELLRSSGAKKGLFSHLSLSAAREIARKSSDRRIRLAADLMRIRLG